LHLAGIVLRIGPTLIPLAPSADLRAMNRVLHWSPVVLGVMFLLSLAYLQRERSIKGQNDFVQLYTAAKLAGTPDLYSRAANLATIQGILGFTMDAVEVTRPPFYAALLKPLAVFPYGVAYAIFSLATFSSMLWFIVRFSKECSALPFFAAISIPLLSAFCDGQDTPFLLAILGVSILLTRRGQDFSAGLILSLCAIKFHLFLFLPVLWLLKKRWRTLGGAACGTIVLTVFGILVAGADSIRQYVQVLLWPILSVLLAPQSVGTAASDPWLNPTATLKPNLHGLVAILHVDPRLEFLLIAVVFIAFFWLTQKTNNYELLWAASLVCGLLVSFHSGIVDDVILFPAFVLVLGSCDNVPLRSLSALILTPIPYFMVLANAPYSAALPISLLLLLGTFCTAQMASSHRVGHAPVKSAL
jgi:hypothetical protein